ncbi:L-lactate permease [Bacillus sp. AK031]
MNFFELITALTPVLAVFLFLVILRMPALKAMPISLSATALLAYFVWKVPAVRISAAYVKCGVSGTNSLICTRHLFEFLENTTVIGYS